MRVLCLVHDMHNCGCAGERRERPRLDRASVFFWSGVPHYYRGTIPSFIAHGSGEDNWIEYIPAPNLRKEGRS